ncbi:hypothetical protein R3I94_006906 [Phoxinus phoxinus]
MSSDSTVSDSGVVTSGVSDVATTEMISRTDSEHTSSSEEIMGGGHIPPRPPPPPPNSPNLPRHRPPSPPRPLPHQEGLEVDMQEFNVGCQTLSCNCGVNSIFISLQYFADDEEEEDD